MATTVEIQGADELLRKLRQLPDRIGRNAGRRALRKGAIVVRDAARRNAKQIDDPATRDQIWKNIAVAGGGSKRERKAGGVMMRVGVLGGARYRKGENGQPGGNSTHWRFVEFGTSTARAQPFMRPALNSSGIAAINAVVSDMQVQIDKELKKIGV